jgi:hypothetical protein
MRSALLLAGVLAGLLFLERSIEPSPKSAESAHRALLSPSEQADLQLTGFALKVAGQRFEYRRSQGVWRCVSAYGAVGDPRRITDLTRALLTRTAASRASTETAETLARFGFDEAAEVEFFRDGEEEHSLLFSIGERVSSPNGSSVFVRREGLDGIWELDSADIDVSITRKKAGLPPLMDRRITAGCELNPGRGILRAFIDFEGGVSLELRPQSDGGQLDWTLSDGSAQSRVLPYRLAGWLAFLQRAPYAGFGDPAELKDRGLTPPHARVTLFPPDTQAIELELGREVAGDTYLLNKTSGMLLLLPKGWSELIAPNARAMTVADGENPWERWLR